MAEIQHVESSTCTREKYNAIQKAREVAEELVVDYRERLLQLSDEGHNQVRIAGILEEDLDFELQYGNAQILRTAVSEALRQLLPPEVAAERRHNAWAASVVGNSTAESRLKGTRARNALHGLPNGAEEWSAQEEEILLQLAPQCLHPESSRYAGKVDWARLTEAMHTYGEFHARKPNAYKQRYSILQKRLAEAPPMPPLPLADDTARLQQDAAVKYRSHY